MPHQGKNRGNRNAALPSGQRKRVTFTISLSGDRLNHFEQYMSKVTMDDTRATDEQLANQAREMIYEWIDHLAF
jgi:hypothetical protein